MKMNLEVAAQQRLLQDRPRMIRFRTIAGLYFTTFDERNLGEHDARWRKLSPTATVPPYRATSEISCRHTRHGLVYASRHTRDVRSDSCSVNAEIVRQSTRWRFLTSAASTRWSCRGMLAGTPSHNYKELGRESKPWRQSFSGTFSSVPQGKKAALQRASTQWRRRQRSCLLAPQAAIVRTSTQWQGIGHRPAGLLLTQQFQ